MKHAVGVKSDRNNEDQNDPGASTGETEALATPPASVISAQGNALGSSANKHIGALKVRFIIQMKHAVGVKTDRNNETDERGGETRL